MSVAVDYEAWVLRAIEKTLKTALGATLVQMGGVADAAAETVEEWVAISPLTTVRDGHRKGQWSGTWLVQVTCFARHAEKRLDGLADAPWLLAGRARAALEDVDIAVSNGTDASATFLGALQVGRGSSAYLDERALQYGGQQSAPPLPNDVHAVALTFEAHAVTG